MGVIDAEFRNTGLERAESLSKDLAWFKEQGHSIPEPSSPGLEYSAYVENLSKKDPQAFLCHFYNTYFAYSAGGRMIGKQVAGKILNGKELEFYKWDGDLSQLLQNFRDQFDMLTCKEQERFCVLFLDTETGYNATYLYCKMKETQESKDS